MADKALRGTKRTCQSGSCGQRFYDLNRDPIICPICGSQYVIAHGPAVSEAEEQAKRPARKLEPATAAASASSPGDEVDTDDALEDVEGDDGIEAGDDDTFLEEEEDEGGDVSGILGAGSGDEDDES